jgi:4-hydroxy-tetrahydrodipicolinate synthase
MAMAPPSLRDDAGALADYYRRIADAELPIILQNAPPPAGCGLSPERVIELASAIAAIEYVKEETLPCGQRITRLLAAAPPNLRGVFGGAGGRYITDELARGACGTMPACELVDLHVEQFRCHRAGDAAGVRRWYNRMLPLLNYQAVFRMAMTKEVLRRRGILRSTHVRAAGPVPDAQDVAELAIMLDELSGEFRTHPPQRGNP